MNKKERTEISAVMHEATVSFSEINGDLRAVYGYEADHIMSVIAIDTLVATIIRTNENPFSIRTNAFSKQKYIAATRLGRALLNALYADVPGIRSCFSAHEFSPRFELFVQSVKDRDLDYHWGLRNGCLPEDLTKNFDSLCGLVNALREEGRRATFKAKLRRYQRSSDKNNASLCQHLRKTLRMHPRINLRRYDLCYPRLDIDTSGARFQPLSQQQVKVHRETLIKSLSKGVLGQHLIGYAWKTDHSALRGFQNHLLLLLMEESLEVQGEINAALDAGWANSTDGKGHVVDCARLAPAYKSTGIGLIDSSDPEAWPVMRKISFQMTRPDSFIKLTMEKCRTFGKSEFVEKRKGHLGNQPERRGGAG